MKKILILISVMYADPAAACEPWDFIPEDQRNRLYQLIDKYDRAADSESVAGNVKKRENHPPRASTIIRTEFQFQEIINIILLNQKKLSESMREENLVQFLIKSFNERSIIPRKLDPDRIQLYLDILIDEQLVLWGEVRSREKEMRIFLEVNPKSLLDKAYESYLKHSDPAPRVICQKTNYAEATLARFEDERSRLRDLLYKREFMPLDEQAQSDWEEVQNRYDDLNDLLGPVSGLPASMQIEEILDPTESGGEDDSANEEPTPSKKHRTEDGNMDN